MKRYRLGVDKGKPQGASQIFIGIDLHKIQWHITIRTEEVELFNGSVPGKWEALKKLLDRYSGCHKQAVYEARYFGFWLYDRHCAPTLLPARRMILDRQPYVVGLAA